MNRIKLWLISAVLIASVFVGFAISGADASAAESGTSVINNILFIQEFTSVETRSDAASNIIIRVDADLNAVGADGAIIMPLSSVSLGGAIPVYYVKTIGAADAVAAWLKSNAVYDALVASDNPALVSRIRQKHKTVRGLIDYRKKSVDKTNVTEIRDEVNENWANVALLPASCDRETVYRLQRLSLTVWTEANGELEVVRAVAAGVNGICSLSPSDIAQYIDDLGEDILIPPIAIAHRGLSDIKRENGSDYHENTIEAAKAAYLQGGADVIEIDIYLTSDNEIVVMHDPTLDRTTNGTGNVEAMTLAQIQQYKIDGVSGAAAGNILDEIPTLGDFFKAFEDYDVNFFVEIKGNKIGIIPYLKAVIQKHSFDDRVSIISFTESYLIKAREEMPHISIGLLYNYNADSMTSILGKIGPLNSTFNPSYNSLTNGAVIDYAMRGVSVWPWTYRSETDFKAYYFYSTGGLTLDYCVWMKAWGKTLTPEAYEITVSPDERFAISAELATYGNGKAETAYTFKKISGDLEIALAPNGYFTVTGEGEAHIILIYQNPAFEYSLITEPIKIISEIPAEPIPEPIPETPEPTGCKSALTLEMPLTVIVTVLFATFIFFFAAIVLKHLRAKN